MLGGDTTIFSRWVLTSKLLEESIVEETIAHDVPQHILISWIY